MQQITLEYRECFASEFEGAIIERQRILVGDAPYSLKLPFNQHPCTYEQTYEAVVVDPETDEETPLPNFMSLREIKTDNTLSEAYLHFGFTSQRDVGDYTIRVYSQLHNYF